MSYQPPHKANDTEKLAAMIAALEAGNDLPPIVVEPNGIRALSGSHRIAAYKSVGRDVPALVLSDADYIAACEFLGVECLDECSDGEAIAQAIVATTDDDDIKAALDDQR